MVLLLAHGSEALPASRHGLYSGEGWVARIDGQEIAHRRDVRLDLSHAAHTVLNLGDDLRLSIKLLDTKILPQLVDEGQDPQAVGKAPHPVIKPSPGGRGERGGLRGELIGRRAVS